MSRREMREQLFKLLFRVEFNPREELAQQEAFFFEDEENGSGQEENAQISEKFNKIIEKLENIDQSLNEKVQGWDTGRMGKVDLTILRLAVYEITFDEEKQAYIVPATSYPQGFTPQVAKIKTSFSEKIVTVGYISPQTSWTDSTTGTISKYVDYVFEKQDGEFYLVAVRESDMKVEASSSSSSSSSQAQ